MSFDSEHKCSNTGSSCIEHNRCSLQQVVLTVETQTRFPRRDNMNSLYTSCNFLDFPVWTGPDSWNTDRTAHRRVCFEFHRLPQQHDGYRNHNTPRTIIKQSIESPWLSPWHFSRQTPGSSHPRCCLFILKVRDLSRCLGRTSRFYVPGAIVDGRNSRSSKFTPSSLRRPLSNALVISEANFLTYFELFPRSKPLPETYSLTCCPCQIVSCVGR